MVVYLEQVVFDNLIINYILLYLTGKLIYKKTCFLRLFLADCLGTIFSAVYPIINLDGVILVALKIILGVCMVLIAFKNKGVKDFLLSFFCFLFLTAICGGLCFALVLALYPNSLMEKGSLLYKGLPMGIILLAVFILLKFAFDVWKKVRQKQDIKDKSCILTISLKDINIKISAYIDTGNLLCYKQKPVIIISYPTFKKLLNISDNDFLAGKYYLQNYDYITTQTANGLNKMLVFEADKINLVDKSKQLDCVLGLSLNNFEAKFGCNALIGSCALMENKL